MIGKLFSFFMMLNICFSSSIFVMWGIPFIYGFDLFRYNPNDELGADFWCTISEFSTASVEAPVTLGENQEENRRHKSETFLMSMKLRMVGRSTGRYFIELYKFLDNSKKTCPFV